MRRAAKRDANERPIITALQLAGWSVFQLSAPGLPDLMCVRRGRVVLIEVKEKGKRKHLTAAQVVFFSKMKAAGLEPVVVETPEEALAAVKPSPMGAAERAVSLPKVLARCVGEPFDADNHNGRPGRKAGGE